MSKVFKVGLIGCGHIAETYFRAHKYFNNFKIIKCADIKEEVSKKCAKIYNLESKTVNQLFKDKEVEIILNLKFWNILQIMRMVETFGTITFLLPSKMKKLL